MKALNIQTSDGRLVTLQGGDAALSKFVHASDYSGQGFVVDDDEEQPLPAPDLAAPAPNSRLRQPEQAVRNVPPQHVENESEEQPMEMPALNFSKEPAKEPHVENESDEQPLALPKMF